MQTDRATRYVSHNLVNCRNNLYTTDQQQFEVNLEGYSWSTCSKHSHDSSIVLWVSSTSSTVDDDDDEFCWQRDRLAVTKFCKFEI